MAIPGLSIPGLARRGRPRGRNGRSDGDWAWHRRLLQLPALALHLLAPSRLVEPSQSLKLLHIALHTPHGKLPLERVRIEARLEAAKASNVSAIAAQLIATNGAFARELLR